MRPWWPMRFLSRVAALAPDEVLATVAELPESDNPQIHEGILDIALQLPGEQSAQLLHGVLRYARTSGLLLPHRLPYLLVHWTNEDQTEAALELAKPIVYFAPDPERAEKQVRRRENPDDLTTGLWPSPRLESWHYQQAMQEGIRPLIGADPYQTAGILISAVNGLTRNRIHQDEIEAREGQDHSEVWHPNLRGPLDEVLRSSDALVYTMTFACEQVWQEDPSAIADLDQRLRSLRWRIFQRLRQHLYALHPNDQTKPWIQKEILNHPDYGRWEHHYEFQQMIRAACETFGQDLLTEDELRSIFDTIRSGPDREAYRRAVDDNYTEELFRQHQRYFHRMQLKPFEAVLFGEYRDYFQQLENETGTNIADEDYLSVGPARSGMMSGRSPRSVEGLAGLEDEELLIYINDWDEEHNDPNDWLVEVTIDALSDEFGQLFQQTIIPDPERLRFWLDDRHRIERPIYIRKMIDAMRSQVEAQDFSQLDRWLDFCEWVLSHPDQERKPSLKPSDRTREDPYWGDCRRAVGDLMGKVISTGLANSLAPPAAAQDRLPMLLDTLCTEYDRALDEDRRVFPDDNDWLSEAINNTRSRALGDLLRAGRWLRTEDPQADVTAIAATLEKRFGSAAKYPLTLPERAVLGFSYAESQTPDEDWAIAHKLDLFPQGDINAWMAAFGVFLYYHRPHRRFFEILEEDFTFAMETLSAQAEQDPSHSPLLDVLGQRLFSYYAGGMFPLVGDDSPLERFYLATAERRQHWADLFEHVGRRLYHVKGELDDEVKRRHEAFIEWRLEVGDPTELTRFDAWLEASCLSIEWRLDAYSRALDVCQFDRGSFWHHWASISGLIPEHTGKVVKCFAKLVAKLQNDAYVTPEPAKRILNAGLASDEPEVRQNAERALETLLANGQFDVTILDE